MNEFRVKLGGSGRVTIPISFRKLLHLEAGEELIIRVKEGELHLIGLRESLKKAQALVQKHARKRSLVKNLRKLRQEEE
jgi:AbrB family looped-hinge helix DNA binding protein